MAALFLSVAANAQLVEISEDFEAGVPAGWSVVATTGDCNWELGTDSGNALSLGSQGMIFNDDACGNGAPVSNVSVLSDVYDISAADGSLDWSYEYYFEDIGGDGVPDFFAHEVSVDGGATWIVVASYADANVELTTDTWANPVAPGDFSTIQFRFTYDDGGDWSWGAGVDNFAFSYTEVLGVSDDSVEGFSFAPNPAQDFITLTAPNTIGRVSVVNVLGQTVIETEINATSSDLDVSGLAAGTYILKVAVGDDSGTYHIIKE